MTSRSSILLACALFGAALSPAVFPVRDARASVSIAATFDGVLRESTSAILLTPVEQTALWENGRIYTYTRVHIDRGIAGDLTTGAEVWVRTLGGIVGKVGQHVDGEPVFLIGRQSLVFLHAGPPGALEVTARAQGQYPVVPDEKDRKLTRIMKSTNVGALFPPKNVVRPGPLSPQAQAQSAFAPMLAADVLAGRTVDEAAREIAAAWKRAHATK